MAVFRVIWMERNRSFKNDELDILSGRTFVSIFMALISTIFRNSSFFYSLRLEYSSLLVSLFLYFLFLSFFV